MGRHRLPHQSHRPRRPTRHRRRGCPTRAGRQGFKVIPRRWIVERTFGWLMHHRRLARDYETHPHRSEAIIHVAMIDLMSRRLTRESTPNWRDT
ncbi:transposase [Streptomyces sp. NBC_01462]|uniref:transposase n=1 Tax=Streptomyces sp. NBC_01462 TaxID=2903876 RepID=UPI002E3612AD|nr:transposase [Streptomyces sp. NBC_01462]